MKLKKQFADFYKEIKIDEEVEDLKEKREVLQGDIENKLPNELKKHGIDLKKSEIRTLDIKEPCVNVSYIENGEEWMHIDLPVYAQYDGNVYLARGSEFAKEGNYSWEDAEP